MSSRFVSAIGLAVLATSASVVRAQSTLTYQQALAMARERAPRVAVARARIEEARGRIVGARIRFRDNPVIDVATGPRKLETGTVTDYEVGINQIFEAGGRRSARIDSAEASVARETAASDASIRQLVRDVAISFARALQAQTRRAVFRSAEVVAKDALDVGGVVALFIARESWNVSSLVGLIGLFGIAVQNSLVLITQTRTLMAEGREFKAALREASIGRVRPKLMTAATAILGLLPLLVLRLHGTEVERPLAIVMIGGLVTSTLFTLLVLPTLYLSVMTNRQAPLGASERPS